MVIDQAALETYNAGVQRARSDNSRRRASDHAAAYRAGLQRRAEAEVAAAGGMFTWQQLRDAHAARERARVHGQQLPAELAAAAREYNRVMHRLKRQSRRAERLAA